jgi:hypothetical protein
MRVKKIELNTQEDAQQIQNSEGFDGKEPELAGHLQDLEPERMWCKLELCNLLASIQGKQPSSLCFLI